MPAEMQGEHQSGAHNRSALGASWRPRGGFQPRHHQTERRAGNHGQQGDRDRASRRRPCDIPDGRRRRLWKSVGTSCARYRARSRRRFHLAVGSRRLYERSGMSAALIAAARRSRLAAAMAEEGVDMLVVYGNAWQGDYLRYATDYGILEGEGLA